MNQCSESIQPQCVWPYLTDKYTEHHIFWLLPTILHKKWTKQVHRSTPQYVNGGSSLILSWGKSPNFCRWSLSLYCLHLTHFKMIHLTKELHLVTQKSKDLIWLIVMPQPAWATCSWYQRTTNSAILQDFGNNTGCCISLATAEFLILLILNS